MREVCTAKISEVVAQSVYIYILMLFQACQYISFLNSAVLAQLVPITLSQTTAIFKEILWS